ncbi:MAG: diguanylate cyclase protein/HDIG protein [Solirubrobacterales bacterium]|jgi:diguanylate cyclase (GGDEF)-like protein/putative nucleotidyltransferase with HDIG domain|nr:diguanylate cyclase protein/HDIG protein [Solirubrobacterales bacterium]
MKGEVDQGIVDQSAVGMRVATFSAGIWLTYVVCVTSAIYVVLTWERPHRVLLLGAFGAGTLGGVIAAQLPRERIVRSRFREVFFFGWSLLDLGLIVLATWADGGTGSPVALTFFIPVVFAAMSYPLGSVLAVAGLSVASYLMLAVTAGGAGWAYEALFAVMLACTGSMSAWQARNHDHQRAALMDVSRADPLTGCLNRRGFEERAVAEISAATRRAGQGAVLVLDIDHFKPVNDRFGHAAGDELLRWVVETIRETVRPNDAIGRIGGDEFAVLFADIAPTDALDSAARVTAALNERAPCSLGMASFPMDGVELEELMRLADVRLYASRHGRPDRDVTGPTERLSWAATLAHAVDMRMNAAHEHSRAVADLAVSIATELGWQPDMLGMLRMAAMLHDIGKVTVPDEILCKPGRLTAEEFEHMKGHSVAGAELVSRIEGLDVIAAWIRHSHESFDGSGYPDGLRGEAIPQASRIMLVADAFDAITSTRPYREALSSEHACEELKRHAGSQFDPACVQALLDHLGARSVSEPPSVTAAAGRQPAAVRVTAA